MNWRKGARWKRYFGNQKIKMNKNTPDTHSSARFWNKQARKYAKSKVSDMAGYEQSVTRTQELLTPESQVLEIGCGTGTTALKHRLACQKIMGTDISSEMVKIAQEKAAADNVTNVEFVTANAEDLPFEPASFDLVMGHNIYHLVDDVAAALLEARRVTKDGGVFITKTPCLGEINVLLRKMILPVMMRLYGLSSVHMFTEDDFIKSIKKAGFKIKAVEHHATKGKDTRPFIVATAV